MRHGVGHSCHTEAGAQGPPIHHVPGKPRTCAEKPGSSLARLMTALKSLWPAMVCAPDTCATPDTPVSLAVKMLSL